MVEAQERLLLDDDERHAGVVHRERMGRFVGVVPLLVRDGRSLTIAIHTNDVVFRPVFRLFDSKV
jgi:hypothetical protein